ncbi:MAG: SPFH domain-containing protein, partial [Pseudomonadota bacterium]
MEITLLTIGIIAIVLFGALAMFAKFYHKVEQGHVMIINTLRAVPEVTFTGGMVYPIIHKREMMEISLKTIKIARSGKDGLICADNIRADIEVTFFLHVNKTTEDVLKVAQAVGCARASHQETLESLFSAKFAEALKTVGKSMDFVALYQERDHFRDNIIRQIGNDLSGYVLEDAAIDYLEQTSLDKLDGHNILDAQGIKK